MFASNYEKLKDVNIADSNLIGVSFNELQLKEKDNSIIKNITHKFISQNLPLYQIANKLEKGETFCRINLIDNHRCNESFKDFQLIWCDIDGEYNVNEYLIKCDKYNLIPSIIYPTFSDVGDFKRFRAIFKLDRKSDDMRDWHLIMNMIDFLFDFKDNSNTTPSQQYFGTNKNVYLYNEFQNYSCSMYDIFLATLQKLEEIDTKTARRKLQQIYERTGVNADTKSISIINYESRDIIFDYLLDQDEFKKLKLKYKTKVNKDKLPKGNRGGYKIKKIEIDTLVNRCELLRKFISLEYLNHYERTYLGNMFYHIEELKYHNGEIFRAYSWYLSVLKQLIPIYKIKSSKLNEPMKKNYEEVVNGIEGVNRSGVIWNCERSCSLFHNCKNNCTNILNLCRIDAPVKQKQMMITSKVDTVSKRFRADYENIMNNLNGYLNRITEVSIFNIETGIGKTEVIVSTKYNVPTLIAVPTHDLKEELYDRMVQAGVNNARDILIIPERPEIEDNVLQQVINNYEKLGMYQQYHGIYKEYAQNEALTGNMIHMNYLNTMENIKNIPHMIAITTHSRAIISHIVEDYKNIIFDEDPSDKMIVSNSALFDDITKLEAIGINNNWEDFIVNEFSQFRKMINKAIDSGKYFIKNETNFKYRSSFKNIAYNELPRTNIWGAMNENAHIYINRMSPEGTTLNYIYKHDISSFNHRNVVILSATPNIAKIEKLFENANIYNYKYPRCKKKGVMIQDLTHSFSKYSLNNNFNKLINYISDNHQDKENFILITYMKFKREFEKAGFIVDDMVHFGNCEGYDHLKGKNLIVVGRMYAPLENYKLLAWYMGDIQLEELDNLKFISRRTIINGFEVTLHCFDDDRVNKYLFYDIEKNLEQAIGRARALREDCKVYIYTNYPLLLIDKYKYLKDFI